MTENWAQVSGEYTLATGKDLRDLPWHLLYDVAYAILIRLSLLNQDEHDALAGAHKTVRNAVAESEMGLPVFATMIPAADEM